ncbi:MAG TPA: beta/gamma crystallin-related protein, partial [Phenylobacterium sp.]|nr:beta/gamma crystallin-related protein [Phenylobacterium sp.]
MLPRLLLASAILLGACAPALAQDRMAPNAQIFSATNFMGRSLTITRETPIIQANWQPRSVRMGGGSSWEVCEQRYFMGRCTVLTGSSTNLTSQLGITRIGSIRPARAVSPTPGPGPGPGGNGQSLRGMAAEFFPAPESRGRRIDACNNQGGSAACITREAANFCRSIGYVSAR